VKIITKLTLVAALITLATNATSADCITQGNEINQTHSLYSKSIDPYAHLLPDLGSVDSLATDYNLDLKPLVVNDLSKLQFRTYDSRSPAAGYTSPYLWDVGQGPGYRSRSGVWSGGSRYPGFSPVPVPTRR